MFKWLYNLFNSILSGGTKAHTNITDFSKALSIGKAMDLAKEGYRVRRVGGSFRYIIYKDDNFWKCIQHDGVLEKYFPLDFDKVDKADYVSCDWYVIS